VTRLRSSGREAFPLQARLARAAAAVAAVVLAACSSTGRPDPTPLETIASPAAGKLAWSVSLGAPVQDVGPQLAGGTWVLAAQDGEVLALDTATGQEQWRSTLDTRIAAGAGTDGRYAAVVTQGNELVVLEQGRQLWRKRINSRVTTAPLVAGERVFVQGLDRVVHAFDVLDGRLLWTQQRPGEALALTQAGVLLPFKDTLLVGFGARLTGLDPTTGDQRFDVAMASPRGTNEVERLADLVAPAARVGDMVCARAFQAAVSCVDAARGSVVWTRAIGGTRGVAADEQIVVATDASDRVTAWKRGTGELLWTSERLRHRTLTAPALIGNAVAVVDFEGQVHFLSRERGDLLLRLPTDGSAGVAAVRAGDTLVVVSRGGRVFGFRLE
jgi:outer membrane protein assembly factor BamB